MKRLKFNFRSMSDGALEVKSQAIIKAMTGSSFFPGPPAELTAATVATTAFSTALSLAKMGGRNEIADKNVKRNALIIALAALANYVMLTANGDEQVLIASGFDITKDREPSAPLEGVQIIALDNTVQPNSILVSVKPVDNAKLYEYQSTPDPITENSEWQRFPSTQASFTFKNLETGKKYWFRVYAMGIKEQVVSSEVQSKVAA